MNGYVILAGVAVILLGGVYLVTSAQTTQATLSAAATQNTVAGSAQAGNDQGAAGLALVNTLIGVGGEIYRRERGPATNTSTPPAAATTTTAIPH